MMLGAAVFAVIMSLTLEHRQGIRNLAEVIQEIGEVG